jgi:hypothetical protein
MTRGDGEKLLTAAMEIVAQCHDDVPGVGGPIIYQAETAGDKGWPRHLSEKML